MRVFRQILLVVIATSAIPAMAQDPWITRLSGRTVQGDGVGYQDGFTSIDWFLPLLPDGEDDIWFADLRVIVGNDAELSANAGTGYRVYVPDQDRIYGVNLFWDSRHFETFVFNQIGVGFESLGRCIDFEVNGYSPAVNDTDQRSLYFSGNNLFVYTVNALSGMDFLVGYNIPAIRDIHARVLGGGYYFDSNQTPDATGWRVRLEAAFRDWLAVSAVAQKDDLYGQTTLFSVELKRPIEHESNVVSQSMRNKFRNRRGGSSDGTIRYRLASPVRRQQQIVLTEMTEVATDLMSNPLTFLHVVPGAAGTGTFENPYGTITDAMADGLAPTSIVYTPQGGTFNENVTLVAGTQLLSNGPDQIVTAEQGSLQLPFSGVSSDLTMLPSTINGDVTLANDTVLRGFSVAGTVSATGVTTAVVDTNRIRQPAAMDAVILTDSTDITLNNLLIDESGGRGIRIDNSSATISSVTLSTAIAGDAIEINSGAADSVVSITDVTISETSGEGIDANKNGAGNLTLSIQNTSVGANLNGVSVVSGGGSSNDLTVAIADTSSTSTTLTGFLIDGSGGAGMRYVSQFARNSVPAAAMDGATFTDITFDATPGGAVDPVSFETLTIGAAPTRVTGAGVSFVNVVGDVDMGDVDILNTAGAGLFVNTSPTLTLSSQTGSTIDTTAGAALDLTDVTTALVFDSILSVTSPDRAAAFTMVEGSLTVTTTTTTDSAMAPFLYDTIPNPFAVTFGDTTITSMQGATIDANETLMGGTAGLPPQSVIYNPVTIIFP